MTLAPVSPTMSAESLTKLDEHNPGKIFKKFNVPPGVHVKPEDISNLSQEEFDRRLDNMVQKSSGGDESGVKITVEEAANIKEAFKKKEFKGLFQEYLDEISDPKNRAEYDAYLTQCENSGKVPDNVHLVQPLAGFVVKTKDEAGRKIFINVCSSEEISKPTSVKVNDPSSGKVGQRWSLPHSVGPQHTEHDKKKNKVPTFDVAFHPDTIAKCNLHPSFKDLVARSALEGVERRQHQQGDTNLTLLKEFRILRNCKCVGGTPMKMNLGSSIKKKKNVETKGRSDKLDKSLEQRMKKGFGKKTKKTLSNDYSKSKICAAQLPADKVNKGVEVPTFKIIYRGKLDLSEFLSGPLSTRANVAKKNKGSCASKRPSELVIKISLPKLKSAKRVNLDVSEKRLLLDKEGKYYLDIPLPFEVDDKRGSAKFDKQTKELVVTVPVVPPPIDETTENTGKTLDPSMDETTENTGKTLDQPENDNQHCEDTIHVGKKEGNSLVQVVADISDTETKINTTKAFKNIKKNNPYIKKECAFQKAQENKFAEEIKARAAAAVHQYKANINQKTLTEKKTITSTANNSVTDTSLPANKVEHSTISTKNATFKDFGEFKAAASFETSYIGYYFRMGKLGLGYYQDFDHPSIVSKNSSTKIKDVVPSYRERQSSKVWTLMIDVAGIDKTSVVSEFNSDNFSISFKGLSGEKSSKEMIQYKLKMSVSGKLEPNKCRFSVTTRNMALVLMKADTSQGIWTQLISEDKCSKTVESGKNEDECKDLSMSETVESVKNEDESKDLSISKTIESGKNEDESKDLSISKTIESGKNENIAGIRKNNETKNSSVETDVTLHQFKNQMLWELD